MYIWFGLGLSILCCFFNGGIPIAILIFCGLIVCILREQNYYNNHRIPKEVEDFRKDEPYRDRYYRHDSSTVVINREFVDNIVGNTNDKNSQNIKRYYMAFLGNTHLRQEMIKREDRYPPSVSQDNIIKNKEESLKFLQNELLRQIQAGKVEDWRKYRYGQEVEGLYERKN